MLSKRIALISIVFDAFADSYAKEQTRSIEGRLLKAATTNVYSHYAFTCFNGMHCECKHTCKERVDQLYKYMIMIYLTCQSIVIGKKCRYILIFVINLLPTFLDILDNKHGSTWLELGVRFSQARLGSARFF